MTVVAYTKCDKANEHKVSQDLLNSLLFDCFGEKAPKVLRTDMGRPYLENSNCDISVSHSGGIAAVAVSGISDFKGDCLKSGEKIIKFDTSGRIGIDVEVIEGKKYSAAVTVAKHFFTESEQADVENADNKIDKFLDIWTEKECICKLKGVGISGIRQADTQNLEKSYRVFLQEIFLDGKEYKLCVLTQKF